MGKLVQHLSGCRCSTHKAHSHLPHTVSAENFQFAPTAPSALHPTVTVHCLAVRRSPFNDACQFWSRFGRTQNHSAKFGGKLDQKDVDTIVDQQQRPRTRAH